jgi:alpha-tubulin suppressor-like RCC1 family protein
MSTNLRALANSIFRKTAWLASTALVATLLVASPVSQTAAEATEAAIAPDSISVGADHACAVVDGGVKCWGSNEYGQLGYGGGASAIAVEAIAPDSGVTQVSAGGFHTCALFAYGDIQCWGKNAEGQLGNGNWNDSYQATDVVIDFQDGLVDLVGATQISAGRYHTCAVVAEGGIKCWGDNSRGQLGVDSDSSYQAIDVVVEVEVDGDPTYPPLTGANQIATGEYHTCAVVAEGGIKCWGDNKYGQLGSSPGEQPNGVDPNWGFSYAPFDVLYSRAPLTGVVQVSAGFGHTCAIVAAGKVMCWGLNTDGQRGEGAFSESSVAATQIVTSVEDPDNPGTFVENIEGNIFLAGPVFVVDDANPSGQITGATNLSAGEYHTCVVMSGGAKCWGYNDTRQLGNGTDTSSANAVEAIAAGAGVSAVAAGDEFSCALLTTEIKCWGTNRSGQLGTGGVFSQATPVTIAGVAGATALAAGEDFSCAVVSGGVKCWGNNWAGQLGNGTDADSATPVDVAGLSGVTAVTAGDNHACALLETGGVKCWGRNDNNQLGNWVYADSLVPVSVLTSVGEPLTGVTKIAAGSDHTCAIVSGSVKCWGYNSYWSQIDTSGSNRLFASPVVGLTSETAIDLGANYYSTCVVVAEGVNCLGGNFGSSTGQQLETYLAIELADATAVALGDGFMCALISGEVFCLGDNSDGQAGITAGSDVSVPVAIEAFNDQAAIDLGDGHACALSIARAVNCWGSNEFAQLGRSVGGSTHIPGVVTA